MHYTPRLGPVDLPDAIVGAPLAAASTHPGYADTKAGNLDAAVRVAQTLVTPELLDKVRALVGDGPVIIQPVLAEEATGRNKLPLAGAALLAQRLAGARVGAEVVQANRPKRTSMDGLSRLFATPVFSGAVERGARYLLLDDTLTQGGTFAGLAAHIRAGGGEVVGAVALTGKQYSAVLSLDPLVLNAARARLGDIEDAFRSAAGHGFDALTLSEARFLVIATPLSRVRSRILAAGASAPQPWSPGEQLTADAMHDLRAEMASALVRGLRDL